MNLSAIKNEFSDIVEEYKQEILSQVVNGFEEQIQSSKNKKPKLYGLLKNITGMKVSEETEVVNSGDGIADKIEAEVKEKIKKHFEEKYKDKNLGIKVIALKNQAISEVTKIHSETETKIGKIILDFSTDNNIDKAKKELEGLKKDLKPNFSLEKEIENDINAEISSATFDTKFSRLLKEFKESVVEMIKGNSEGKFQPFDENGRKLGYEDCFNVTLENEGDFIDKQDKTKSYLENLGEVLKQKADDRAVSDIIDKAICRTKVNIVSRIAQMAYSQAIIDDKGSITEKTRKIS